LGASAAQRGRQVGDGAVEGDVRLARVQSGGDDRTPGFLHARQPTFVASSFGMPTRS
jgi:hypothetical protein